MCLVASWTAFRVYLRLKLDHVAQVACREAGFRAPVASFLATGGPPKLPVLSDVIFDCAGDEAALRECAQLPSTLAYDSLYYQDNFCAHYNDIEVRAILHAHVTSEVVRV